ncbi:MAG TPA: anthranilate phosphoribosyltransferase [Clostridiaceae bacterium]
MSITVLQESLQKVSLRKDLVFEEAYGSMLDLMSGEASDAQIGAFLVALKVKGESIDEIAGLAKGMREKAVKVKASGNIIDTCGTGGDRAGTFNISTTAAFVIAGAGVKVAKHGNRSISSKSGSADVLVALGISIESEIHVIEKELEEIGIAFLFAPRIHTSMKHVMKARKDLAMPTVFNILGPLTNPVDLTGQVMGIYRRDLVLPLARVLRKLGRKNAVVVNGGGNIDEASLSNDNYVAILNGNIIEERQIDSKSYGLDYADNSMLLGGSPEENAKITISILSGGKGPHRDVVLLNSALGLITSGTVETIEEGIKIAEESIDSGKALAKLIKLQNFDK